MSKRTGALKHIHRYQKIGNIWYCSLPDCTHYMPLNMMGGILGKSSICFQCGNKFTIDETTIQIDQPICLICKIKSDTGVVDMDELIHEMGLNDD